MRIKHYAGILLIELWADLIYEYDMDTEKAAACLPVTRPLTLSTRLGGGKDGEDRAVGMSRFISNISGFISSRMVECLWPIYRAD